MPQITSPRATAETRPLITLAITCFNAAGTIERAIASAQAQSWPHTEILIVDDASDDDSVDRINALAATDTRIRLLRHERNRGCAAARNTLIDHARGELLAYLDDDDVSHPDRLTRQYEAIRDAEVSAGTALVACYTSRRVVFPDGSTRLVHSAATVDPVPSADMIVDQILLDRRRPGYSFGELGSGTMMARVSTFRSIGGFDERFRRSAEWDWAVRLALAGGEFVGVAEPLLTQYITHTRDKGSSKPLEYALLLRRKHSAHLRARGLYLFSLLMARAKFHYARGHRIRFRLCLLGGLLVNHRQLLLQRGEYRRMAEGKQASPAA